VRGGLDIENFIKSPLIYSVSYFDLGGLGTLFGGVKPTKAPRGDGTGHMFTQTIDRQTFRMAAQTAFSVVNKPMLIFEGPASNVCCIHIPAT